jgi:hypothetical protein
MAMWRIETYCTAKSAIFEAAGKMATKTDQTAKLASRRRRRSTRR